MYSSVIVVIYFNVNTCFAVILLRLIWFDPCQWCRSYDIITINTSCCLRSFCPENEAIKKDKLSHYRSQSDWWLGRTGSLGREMREVGWETAHAWEDEPLHPNPPPHTSRLLTNDPWRPCRRQLTTISVWPLPWLTSQATRWRDDRTITRLLFTINLVNMVRKM